MRVSLPCFVGYQQATYFRIENKYVEGECLKENCMAKQSFCINPALGCSRFLFYEGRMRFNCCRGMVVTTIDEDRQHLNDQLEMQPQPQPLPQPQPQPQQHQPQPLPQQHQRRSHPPKEPPPPPPYTASKQRRRASWDHLTATSLDDARLGKLESSKQTKNYSGITADISVKQALNFSSSPLVMVEAEDLGITCGKLYLLPTQSPREA